MGNYMSRPHQRSLNLMRNGGGFVLILEEVATETQLNDDVTLRARCTCRM